MWQSTTWCRCFKKKIIKPAFVNCSLAFSYPSGSLIGFAVRCYWLLRYSPFLWLNVVIALHYFTTMNWNFPFQPKKVSQKLLQYSMCSNKGVFFKEMRHLHQASQLCSGWYGIFCLFACWCNRDISVPHSPPLLIKQLHNRMVCPESPSQRFCRWRARLCALLQRRCLKEHLQLFHPLGLNGGPQSWYISYLWFCYR